jgi:hypothetical protein
MARFGVAVRVTVIPAGAFGWLAVRDSCGTAGADLVAWFGTVL